MIFLVFTKMSFALKCLLGKVMASSMCFFTLHLVQIDKHENLWYDIYVGIKIIPIDKIFWMADT
jgi:hypothetical protein